MFYSLSVTFTYAVISEHLSSRKEQGLACILPGSFSFPAILILSGNNYSIFPGPFLKHFPSCSNVLVHKLALPLEIKDPCELILHMISSLPPSILHHHVENLPSISELVIYSIPQPSLQQDKAVCRG